MRRRDTVCARLGARARLRPTLGVGACGVVNLCCARVSGLMLVQGVQCR